MDNSSPIIIPLIKTGDRIDKKGMFLNFIFLSKYEMTDEISVASVPKNKSKRLNEAKFAIKHPTVKPIIPVGVKQGSIVKTSAILNWIFVKEMPQHKYVTAA